MTNRNSRAGSIARSVDSQSLSNYDWRENISKRIYGPTSIAGVSTVLNPLQRGSDLLAQQHKNQLSSSIYSSKESLNGTISSATNPRIKSSISTTNIEDAFAFAEVYHVFENHRGDGKFTLSITCIVDLAPHHIFQHPKILKGLSLGLSLSLTILKIFCKFRKR